VLALGLAVEQTTFSKRGLLALLAQLRASGSDYVTLYASPSSFSRHITELAIEFSPLAQEIREALSTKAVTREAQRYGTGAVVFWSQSQDKLIVLPPFAVPGDRVFWGRPETSALHQLLEKERTLGLVLVTWGSYAIGVFEGDRLEESKTGTGYIHKRHRKGGRSETRFARRTEEQKRDFLRKVAHRIDERFRSHRPEQIFFGGNRLILKPLLKECPYLQSEARQISKRFLNVRYADREALLGSLEDVHKSVVFSLGQAAKAKSEQDEGGAL
jgi:hypothetical protein